MSEPIPEVIIDPTPTDPLPLVGDNGAFRPDWISSFGDDFGEVPDNMPKDLQTLAKGFVDSQAMVAKHGQTIGDMKKASEENKPLGAPEVYTLSQKPDGVMDDQWNQEAIDADIGRLREGNFTDDQANLANTMFNEKMTAHVEAQTQAKELELSQAVQTLKDEWGNDYDGNMVAAKETAIKAGVNISSEKIGNEPEIIKFLHQISKSVGESVIKGAGPANTVGITGSENCRAEAKAIVQNSSNPLYKAYWNAGDPQHAEAHEKVGLLNKQHVQLMGGQ